MKTNHQMNYYDYGKNLDIQGVMPVIGGGGVNPDTHEYVDLGLSVKWATCNIGANSPEEAGLYFAWGETQGYASGQVGTDKYFAWDGDHADYELGKYNTGDSTNYGMTEYSNTDKKTVLDPEDDAATVNWGEEWRMPTVEEFNELTAKTEYEWTTFNGVQGGKFTSTVEGYTDKFLFFPAVGSAAGGEVGDVGGGGDYWSASLGSKGVSSAWRLNFLDGSRGVDNDVRYYGFAVRPVRL